MGDNNNGWIESIDPTSGRTFYANKYTRTTQWDPPPGFRSSHTNNTNNHNIHGASASSSHHHHGRGSTTTTNTDDDNFLSGMDIARAQMESMKMNNSNNRSAAPPDPNPNTLPEGWEEMTDATTGRTFFIDHATKTTSWERPTTASSAAISSSSSKSVVNNNNDSDDTTNGFGFSTTTNSSQAMMMKLNQHGSHNTSWEDNPHSGSRSASHSQNHNQQQHGYERQHSYNATNMGLESFATTLSSGPPPLDFVVVSVPDAMRMDCPGCYTAFTYTKRRHHCRLCGVSSSFLL